MCAFGPCVVGMCVCEVECVSVYMCVCWALSVCVGCAVQGDFVSCVLCVCLVCVPGFLCAAVQGGLHSGPGSLSHQGPRRDSEGAGGGPSGSVLKNPSLDGGS